jgi:hypothetical protein
MCNTPISPLLSTVRAHAVVKCKRGRCHRIRAGVTACCQSLIDIMLQQLCPQTRQAHCHLPTPLPVLLPRSRALQQTAIELQSEASGASCSQRSLVQLGAHFERGLHKRCCTGAGVTRQFQTDSLHILTQVQPCSPAAQWASAVALRLRGKNQNPTGPARAPPACSLSSTHRHRAH